MTARASAYEVNFDCMVGPTHHFGGLSLGNLASTKNRWRVSQPKRAALQGLEKMRTLFYRGFLQAVLPPHERPHMPSFRNVGFVGSDVNILRSAWQKMPSVFSSFCSSSSMWAANAATVSPSCDALDQKIHISPANLVAMLHRSIEPAFAFRVFKSIFADDNLFTVHPPLLQHDDFSDEGAANHSRLCPQHASRAIEIFVYGKEAGHDRQKAKRFPARQSSLANAALALRHQLRDDYVLNIEQNPLAIDEGAFHNDVVAVANESLLLCHDMAFCHQAKTIELITERYRRLFAMAPQIVEIASADLPLTDAVSSYLFNSQILTKPAGGMLLFAPMECRTNERAHKVIEGLVNGDNLIDEVTYFDVSESMANGGGPACLRLRVLVNDAELTAIKPSVLATEQLFSTLAAIIERYYVDELTIEHFFDQGFLLACQAALDEIAQALGLGAIYDFQGGINTMRRF